MHPTTPSKPLRAYGDREGDGMVQLSFVLQLPPGVRAREAAKRFAEMHGLAEPIIATMEACSEGTSFFVVYGQSRHEVDADAIEVAEVRTEALSHDEVERRVAARLGRKIVVVGACTGSDAHTVGIDAILNVKGHSGEKGLEYYREIKVVNLGSQVEVPSLVTRANAEGADAVLVSQVVTQRDAHISNAKEMSAAFDAAGDRPLLVVGGPRFDPSMAAELGVDKIFGKGTTPGEVASYLAYALAPDGDDSASEQDELQAGGAAA